MSSPGSISVNSGPFVFRTYETEYIDHNTYLIQKYDYPVSSNRVLITSTNGLLVPSNNIYVSSITTSSLFSNVISTNTIYVSSYAFSTFDVSTLVISSLIVSSINTNTLSYSTISTNTLNITYATISSFFIDTILCSSLIGGNITLSSLTTSSLTAPQISFSSMIGSSIHASSVYVSTFSGPAINISSNFNQNIIVSSLFVSTLINSTIAVSSMFGCTITVSTAYASSIVTNFFTSSVFSQNNFYANSIRASSLIVTYETVSTLTGTSLSSVTGDINVVYASGLFISTLNGDTMTAGQIYATSTTVGAVSFSTLSVSTLSSFLCTTAALQANNINYSIITGSSMTVSTLQPTTLTGNIIGLSTLITNTLTANTINTQMLVTSTISLTTFITNQAVYGQTLKKTSMVALRPLTIQFSDIKAEIDNPATLPQVYTFGSTIQNQWIAAGSGSANVATGNNGITWPTTRTVVDLIQFRGIVWTGNIWVATGGGVDNSIATSINGLDWQPRGDTLQANGSSPTISIGEGTCILCWVNLLFITGLTGSSGFTVGVIGYSNDNGTTWYNITGSSGFTSANGFAFNGIIAVVVGSGTTNSIVWSDQFSVEWNSVLNSNDIFTTGNTVIWTGQRWVAGGKGPYRIAYSLDGITWTGSTSGNSVFSTGVGSSSPEVYGIGWNGSMMIAVGFDAVNTIAYSMDEGETWVGLGITIVNFGFGITWNGQMWVVTGRGINNSIAYSYDGINWYGSGTSAIDDTGFCVAFNNRRPYTLTFPTNVSTATIGSISPSYTFPITIPKDGQLDITSDAYYNTGYTNFSMTVRGQYS